MMIREGGRPRSLGRFHRGAKGADGADVLLVLVHLAIQPAALPSGGMMQRRRKMGGSGRITIPAAHRKALGLEIGDELILCVEQGELRIKSPKPALERARRLIARYVPD